MLTLDWLNGTFPADKTEIVLEKLVEMFGEPSARKWGRYRYEESFEWELVGASVFVDRTKKRCEEIHGGRHMLMMTGTAMRTIPAEKMHEFVSFMVQKCWLKATRLDCAWDDYEKRITPENVWKNYCETKKYTRFRRCAHHIEILGDGSPTSDTVYWGCRGENGGGSYLRYYRKDLESKGEIDAYRWEVEYSGQKAQEAFFALSKCPDLETMGRLVGALVGGSIDFVERSGKKGDEKHLNRASRVEWWQSILDRIGCSPIRGHKIPSTIEKSKQWVKKSVSTCLSTIQTAIGEEQFWPWLESMVEVGKCRMQSRHMLSVKYYEEKVEMECHKFFENAS